MGDWKFGHESDRGDVAVDGFLDTATAFQGVAEIVIGVWVVWLQAQS
jgi:hypothetical protein